MRTVITTTYLNGIAIASATHKAHGTTFIISIVTIRIAVKIMK